MCKRWSASFPGSRKTRRPSCPPTDPVATIEQTSVLRASFATNRSVPANWGTSSSAPPTPKPSQRFFVDGFGFKVSDQVEGIAAFLRCSTDHHNLLIQPSPVAFLHHTSWQVDDVDEVGRGAMRMLEGHPERHVWGLGRHFIGSNFFWYLRDPAGNFSEYYSDMDTITDDQLWTPGTWEPSLGTLYAWGPDVPPSMLEPEDLADLMASSHPS